MSVQPGDVSKMIKTSESKEKKEERSCSEINRGEELKLSAREKTPLSCHTTSKTTNLLCLTCTLHTFTLPPDT